jgi:hypothetical protein
MDFKTLRTKKHWNHKLGVTRQNYLSMPRDHMDRLFGTQRMGITCPEPMRKTMQYYTKQNKMWKTRISIDRPDSKFLKDPDLMRRKTVF